MSRIPTYQDQISRRGLPSISAGPQATAAAFGAERAQTLGAVGSALRQAGPQVGIALQNAEDKNSVRDAVTTARERMRNFMNTEVSAKQGRDAAQVFNATQKFNDELKREITSGLTTGRQQNMFAAVFDTYALSEEDSAQRHQIRETKRWEEASLDAANNAALQDTLSNPYDEGKVITNLVEIANNTGKRWQFLGPKFAKVKAKEAVSAYHTATISQMLSDVRPGKYAPLTAAEKYMEKWSDQMEPVVRKQLKNNIAKTRNAVRAEQIVNVIDQSGISNSEKIEMIRTMKTLGGSELTEGLGTFEVTKDIRDLAEKDMSARISKDLQFKRLRKTEQVTQVTNNLATQGINAITPTDVARELQKTTLAPAEKEALQGSYNKLIAARDKGRLGVAQDTNYIRWYAASRTPAFRRDANGNKIDPATGKAFTAGAPLDVLDFENMNFTAAVGFMNQPDIEKLNGLQDRMKKTTQSWEDRVRAEGYKAVKALYKLPGDGDEDDVRQALIAQNRQLIWMDRFIGKAVGAVPADKRTAEGMYKVVYDALQEYEVEHEGSPFSSSVSRFQVGPTQAERGELELTPQLTSAAREEIFKRTGVPVNAPINPSTNVASVGSADAMKRILLRNGMPTSLKTKDGREIIRLHVSIADGKIISAVPKGDKRAVWERPPPVVVESAEEARKLRAKRKPGDPTVVVENFWTKWANALGGTGG